MKNRYLYMIAFFLLLFGFPNRSFGQCNFNISNANPADATCGNADVSVEFFISGGTLPFTFEWSGGIVSDSNVITGMASGTYDVTVSDSEPCSEVIQVVIESSDGPVIDDITVTGSSCGGLADGIAIVTVSGGQSAYESIASTQWSNSPLLAMAILPTSLTYD
ncbi:MAG: hypothetical protein ACI9XO_005067 [Paraglaciecola sp.]|jgi:hypothetical protein